MVQGYGQSADRIVFVGHATVLIEMDGATLLTDPLLRGGVAHLRRQTGPVDIGLSAGSDAVLLSHLHRDHLDLPSLRMLGRDARLLAPAGAGQWLRRRGFRDVTEMGVGDSENVGPLAVTAVPARHDGRRRPGGPQAQALGYVVRGRRALYFAGDTELFDEMSQLASDLDVALLPVAGWGRRLGPGHMDPLQAARAACMLMPRVAIPVHWGTLLPIFMSGRDRKRRLEDPPHVFAENVARLARGIDVRILYPGEGLAI
jgi:L-ascorbate metabolism protein UlaG (beta-lactamase superfamily)